MGLREDYGLPNGEIFYDPCPFFPGGVCPKTDLMVADSPEAPDTGSDVRKPAGCPWWWETKWKSIDDADRIVGCGIKCSQIYMAEMSKANMHVVAQVSENQNETFRRMTAITKKVDERLLGVETNLKEGFTQVVSTLIASTMAAPRPRDLTHEPRVAISSSKPSLYGRLKRLLLPPSDKNDAE